MSRTPLFQILKNAFVKARLLEHKAISSDQIEEQEYRLRIPRRKFLTGTAAVISTSVLTPKIIQASSAVQPTVAIIGAGLTGLHCAYRLFKAGIRSTIFEASGRIGGRIQTARGAFPSDQVIELGGEFLDTGHKNLYALLRELGVQTYDIFASDTTESNLSYIDGRKISKAEMADAFRPIVRQVAAVLKKAKADPSTLRQIDRMNIREWLETMPDISPMVKKSLEVGYTIEFGLDADEQSALNLINMVNPNEESSLIGDSDMRFMIRGGNDTLTTRLAQTLPEGSINTKTILVRIKEVHKAYELTFENEGRTFTKNYEIVVLSLPFSTLRLVDMQVKIDPLQRELIKNLGYATNAKLIGGFSERIWRTKHNQNGRATSNTELQQTWESSRAQAGHEGVITNFLGGKVGLHADRKPPEERFSLTLDLLEPIFPGIKGVYLPGSVIRKHWPTSPYYRGSYACARPGQLLLLNSEKAGKRIHNIHLCGEHLSPTPAAQGFMEGACLSGAKVARDILLDLRQKELAQQIPVIL